MLVGVTLLALLVLMPDELEAYGVSLVSSAAFVPNFHFLQQAGYFDAAVDSKPLLHLWSLGVEEQFYLGWPLLLVVLVRRLDPSALRISILVVALVSLALYGVISSHAASAAFYLPFTRFWQLLAGAMLAAAPHATQALRASPGWCHMLSVAGVALMLGAILGAAGGAPTPLRCW